MTDQTEDRFKGTGQFHPDKSWARIQQENWERKASARPAPSQRKSRSNNLSTFLTVLKYIGYTIGGIVAVVAILTFHALFPKALPAIGTALLWFGGIYVVTCIVSTSKKIDALQSELKGLRYDLNDLKNRL